MVTLVVKSLITIPSLLVLVILKPEIIMEPALPAPSPIVMVPPLIIPS